MLLNIKTGWGERDEDMDGERGALLFPALNT